MAKKRYYNLFDLITSEENFDSAYEKTQKGKLKFQKRSLIFSQNLTYNLNQLRQSLIDGNYKPESYYSFYVYEPKKRLIYAPAFKDKIIQHAVNNILKDVYNKCYIKDSYACIEDKGTHKCVLNYHSQMKIAKWKWGDDDSYIVKCDISKFFYNINREILKKILRKKINCEKTLDLLFKIIDSSPGDKGLPLGNLTSQIFANIYLNELDNYIKRKMKMKLYIRYADDFMVFCKSKKQAQVVIELIKRFNEGKLSLELNPLKSMIFKLKQGVNAIGFKTKTTHRLLRNDSKKRIKRKIKSFPFLINSGRMTIIKATQMLNSWLGHCRLGNYFNFIISLLKRFNFLQWDKTRLIVKENIYAIL